MDCILQHYSLEVDKNKKEAFVQCKDLASVDIILNEFNKKKSFFTVSSYQDLLENVDSEVMNKKALLHLIKRNNEEMQNINDKTLERIINSTKKVK